MVRGLVLKDEPRFEEYEVQFSEGSEVRGSVFSGSTQH